MQPTVVAPGILAPPLPSCVTVGKVLPLTAPSVTVRGGGSSTAPLAQGLAQGGHESWCLQSVWNLTHGSYCGRTAPALCLHEHIYIHQTSQSWFSSSFE